MTIRIVIDSALDVPQSLAAELGITVIPVYINIGQESYLDGVELPRREFYENLNDYPVPPTTAAPATGTFKEVYEKLSAEGATEILSLHIATTLSNTYNAARLGAEAANSAPVILFDTRQITMGGGLLAIVAAEAAKAGCTVPEIMEMLKESVPHTRVFAALDTLESLRRSGRVSWTEFGLGTILRIKPVMMVYNGEVKVVAKIRTRKRSIQHTLEVLRELTPLKRAAVLHANAPAAARQLYQQAQALFPTEHPAVTMEITPAIGAHVGPGAVGFACITTGDR